MANRVGREALRGEEVKTLDLIAEDATPEEWAELLLIKGPVKRAARRGNRRLVQKLTEAGEHSCNALHEAVLGGHGEVVNGLLESGASINSKDTSCPTGDTPLHCAANVDNVGMVQMLIHKGADKDTLNDDEFTPLCTAALLGHSCGFRSDCLGCWCRRQHSV